MSPTKDLYKQIWETAFARGSITLTYKTHAEAARMRLNLYVGVRAYRADPNLDMAFHQKLQDLELLESKEDGNFLVRIALKSLNPLAQDAARQLGLLSQPDDTPKGEF
jgi:hypothetical protein